MTEAKDVAYHLRASRDLLDVEINEMRAKKRELSDKIREVEFSMISAKALHKLSRLGGNVKMSVEPAKIVVTPKKGR